MPYASTWYTPTSSTRIAGFVFDGQELQISLESTATSLTKHLQLFTKLKLMVACLIVAFRTLKPAKTTRCLEHNLRSEKVYNNPITLVFKRWTQDSTSNRWSLNLPQCRTYLGVKYVLAHGFGPTKTVKNSSTDSKFKRDPTSLTKLVLNFKVP